MKAEDSLLELIGDIYDCAISPERWPLALERIATLLSGSNVALTLHSMRNPSFDMRAKWRMDPQFETAMLANYAINPMVPMIWYLGEGEAFSVLSKIDEEEFRQTQFYKNTHGAFGLRDSAVGVLAKSVSHFGAISVQRDRNQEPFDSQDVDMLGKLTPHLRRAVMISELLDARAFERNQLSAMLDLMTVGIVLAEGDGRIVHANLEAERLLADGSPLTSERGIFTAQSPHAKLELQSAIGSAARGVTIDIPRSGHVVALESESGKGLAVWVLPLDGGLRRDLGAEFSARVAIFVRELGDPSPMPGELFVRRYAVTPAESRILTLVVQGMTMQEAARTLGISAETVKTHLKSLFEKTGTQRQTELVRLAMATWAPASS